MKVVLASKSPRRREILELLGLDFEVFAVDTCEDCDITEPGELVETLARRKGEASFKEFSLRESTDDVLFIACDTLVYAKGEFLGKPQSRDDARRMLSLLSGDTHEVWSGIYLYFNGRSYVSSESTGVDFAEMSGEEIEEYLDSGEPFDKAGAYAVQGGASRYILGLQGDYFNVVGLPVNLLYTTLKEEFGIVI